MILQRIKDECNFFFYILPVERWGSVSLPLKPELVYAYFDQYNTVEVILYLYQSQPLRGLEMSTLASWSPELPHKKSATLKCHGGIAVSGGEREGVKGMSQAASSCDLHPLSPADAPDIAKQREMNLPSDFFEFLTLRIVRIISQV